MRHGAGEGQSSTFETVAFLRNGVVMYENTSRDPEYVPRHVAQETTPLDDRPTAEIPMVS